MTPMQPHSMCCVQRCMAARPNLIHYCWCHRASHRTHEHNALSYTARLVCGYSAFRQLYCSGAVAACCLVLPSADAKNLAAALSHAAGAAASALAPFSGAAAAAASRLRLNGGLVMRFAQEVGTTEWLAIAAGIALLQVRPDVRFRSKC